MNPFDAVCITVSDLDRSIDLYRSAFSLGDPQRLSDADEPTLAGDVAVFHGAPELWLYRPTSGRLRVSGFPHIMIRVADEVLEEARAQAQAAGFELLQWTDDGGVRPVSESEPTPDPLGAYYPMRDPDGNLLEIRSAAVDV